MTAAKAKRRPRQWSLLATVNGNRLVWVHTNDTRQQVMASLNRPAGDRCIEVIITEVIKTKKPRRPAK